MKNKLNKKDLSTIYTLVAGIDTGRMMFQPNDDEFFELINNDEQEFGDYAASITCEIIAFFDLNDEDGELLEEYKNKANLIFNVVYEILEDKWKERKLMSDVDDILNN